MKLDRLIGILSILLQKEQVTAPALARQFEVSQRTILRDVDTLCRAGIPIQTRQGPHGGISILENYKLDRTLLSNREMQDVLAGLRSLDSIHSTHQYTQLMEKLSPGSSDFLTGNQSILIQLSAWNKDALSSKIALIRSAIEQSRTLSFCYYAPSGEGPRTVEPYYLIFRWSSWYLWGFCTQRQDFRLFKLNRMTDLTLSSASFPKRAAPLPDLSNERVFPVGIAVKALFDPSCKWRLVEEFGADSFEVQADGKLLFQADFTNRDNLLTWLLTFGDQAVLLEPKELRRALCALLERTQTNYKGDV